MTDSLLLRAGYGMASFIVRPALNVLTNKEWIGREHLPDTGFILVANHISELDPLTLAHMVYVNGQLPFFLAKKELFELPVVGGLLTRLKQIPVDRSRGGGESLKVAEEVLSNGGVIIIYPEGTITSDPDGWPMQAKTGAARLALKAGAPVYPAGQWGINNVLPRGAKKPQLRPRHTARISIGPEVPLQDLREGPMTGTVLNQATRRMMDAISREVGHLRGSEPPQGRWNPMTGKREAAR